MYLLVVPPPPTRENVNGYHCFVPGGVYIFLFNQSCSTITTKKQELLQGLGPSVRHDSHEHWTVSAKTETALALLLLLLLLPLLLLPPPPRQLPIDTAKTPAEHGLL
jgi:hypothetical protein